MTCSDASQHRPWQHVLAKHLLSGGHDGERSRRWNTQRVHRFADQIFAQHRPDRRAAVTAARERRATGSFQLDVAKNAVAIFAFAQKDRSPVAKLRNEVPELMPGISHRNRRRVLRELIARKHRGGPRLGDVRVQPELFSQRTIENNELRVRNRRGFHRRMKPRR
jgi:hypothetical protein